MDRTKNRKPSSTKIKPECIDPDPEQGFTKRKRIKGEIVGENEVRQSARNKRIDRLSELSDNVLLHIMNFMDTEEAVQTCVLSKRWRNLCKCLTNLTFNPKLNCRMKFRGFVSWVLTTRADSYSLLNLTIHCSRDHEFLDSVIEYALCHNVQQLSLKLNSEPAFKQLMPLPLNFGCKSLPLIFECRSLTSLKLGSHVSPDIILPKSLHLPALRSLDLRFVQFTASDDGCFEPFSNCLVLNNLILDGCSVENDHNHKPVLVISNPTLYDLRIDPGGYTEVVLSTPCLKTVIVNGYLFSKLSTVCNLACLEEVKFELSWVDSSNLLVWLQVLANVKMLTFSSSSLLKLQDYVLDLTSTEPQLPCFVRLEAIKVNKRSKYLCDEEVNKAVKYLFQNSPMDTVDIIIMVKWCPYFTFSRVFYRASNFCLFFAHLSPCPKYFFTANYRILYCKSLVCNFGHISFSRDNHFELSLKSFL